MHRISYLVFHLCTAALAFACAIGTAWAQDIELGLRPIPSQISAGQGVFVEVEATFPDTCAFGPEGELTFALNIVPDSRVDAFYRTQDPGACGDALTYARAVFGPLPFEWIDDGPTMEISFTLERGDGMTGFGETAVEVVDEPPAATPESGFWWNPGLPGHGLSLDRQGRTVFGALFSFDESGRPAWRILQAPIEGSIVATDLLKFENGNCLLCGEPWRGPDLLQDRVPVHLVFDGPAGAWLRTGPEPGVATGLQRFHLEPVARTPATAIPASLPDLAGIWVRVENDGTSNAVSAAAVRIERIPERESEGEVVFGLFEQDDAEPAHTLSCSPDQTFAYRSCVYAIEVGDPGPPVYLVPWSDVGTDLIEIEAFGERLVRVPGSD